jgi:hypothetical protein
MLATKGCFRVTAEEEFSMERSQERSSSERDLYDGETDAHWKSSLGDMNINPGLKTADEKKLEKARSCTIP